MNPIRKRARSAGLGGCDGSRGRCGIAGGRR